MHGLYDLGRSYEENYHEGPFILERPPARLLSSKQTFLGFNVHSRFGLPAGPLLNSKWILAYADLGFDLLTYKTVRTVATPSHPPPNCIFVQVTDQLSERDFGRRLVASMEEPVSREKITMTNSFGMPSRDPKVWQADIEQAKKGLALRGEGQVLIVSVVGTPGEGDLAADYARGASLAKEAGADIIEMNLSCPNVATGEGALYTDPPFSRKVSKAVKQAIGPVPLIMKVGYLANMSVLSDLLKATAPFIDAISGINTLSFEVVDSNGAAALPGRLRSGVCGAAILGCAIAQAVQIVKLKQKERYDFAIVGVGGVMTTDAIRQYFAVGVDAVMAATGAMWDPFLAYRYWKEGS